MHDNHATINVFLNLEILQLNLNGLKFVCILIVILIVIVDLGAEVEH